MNDDQDQRHLGDEEVRAISAHVQIIVAQARSPHNSPTRLFDSIQGLLPIPQLLEGLVALRAEVVVLRPHLGA